MYHAGGTSYVYLIYGMYSCMNIAAMTEGVPQAVLLRSVIPADEQSEKMMQRLRLEPLNRRRQQAGKPPFSLDDGKLPPSVQKHLADGPGKLCIAMDITKKDNDIDMVESDTFYVTEGKMILPAQIKAGETNRNRLCRRSGRLYVEILSMSLQFIFGPSGSGKSRWLYETIIARSEENPRQNFLIIVPDQFTMQTQKDLVTLHNRGGIMNIDVLSSGRLGHRILEEVGREQLPVLDDLGKSRAQKVASGLREELPVLGSLLHKQGYIHEVKSAISEFMQYGIGTEDVEKLIAFSRKRGALALKLKDLETLYKGFTEYIRGNFITTEETLDVLRRSLKKSKLLSGECGGF